jgi:ubiquitin carboxyl-terminal hydrolase 5/13
MCSPAVVSLQSLDDWFSPAIDAKTTAIQTRRFKTFPKVRVTFSRVSSLPCQYLLVAANKFYHSANWLPTKRDIALDVPDELDLSELKAQGQQPGEELLPENGGASAGTFMRMVTNGDKKTGTTALNGVVCSCGA